MSADMGYMQRPADKLSDPRALQKSARSVVSLGVSYYPGDHPENEGGGRVARYAWGRDYHEVIKARLFELRGELEEALNEYRETIGLYFGRIDDPELEILFHREAPLRVLMSSTHALCEKAALRMEDLRGCKVILVNSDPEVMRQLQNRLESVGCPPQIMLDGAEWEQAVELIQSAGYISFCLPPGNLSNARLQTREIEDLGLTLDFNMAVMRGVAMTDAERRFVEYVVQMMTANHGGDEAKKR